MIKIDKTTLKLLAELDFDARQSITQISSRIGLSKKGTEYRISELEKKGFINRYYPIIDFFRLGFKYNRAFIKLQYLNPDTKKIIEQKIIANPYINFSFWTDGEYDLGVTFWTRTEKEYLERLRALCAELSEVYATRRIDKVVSLCHYSFPYTNKRKKMIIAETENIEKIDRLDYAILRELNRNARLTSTQIAENVNANYKTVIYRMREMEKKKILAGFRCSTNFKAMHKHFAKIFFQTKHETAVFKEMLHYLDTLPEVVYIVDQIGEYDIDIELFCADEDAFNKTMDRITGKYSSIIISMHKIIFRENIKISYLPYMKEFVK